MVDEQETVVRSVEGVDRDWGILRVVAPEVELQLLAEVAGVYGGRHSAAALVEQGEHGVVDIVVDKYNGCLCLAYEVGREAVGVEYLAVEEGRGHDTIECIGEGTCLHWRN